MNCPTCGNANAADAAFCGVCYEVLGRKNAAATSLIPSAAPAPPPGETLANPSLLAVAVAIVFVGFVLARPWLASLFMILDWVNIAFHEGGHVVFSLLGNRFIYVAGGTAMQLLLPLAATVHFLKRKEKISACVTLFWFGQNFLGIGKYIADARAQQLDLLAGGVHDWTYLLETTGLLIHDVGIGKGAEIFGCLVMAVALVAGVVFSREEIGAGDGNRTHV